MGWESWIPWKVARMMDTEPKTWPIGGSAMFVDVTITYICPLLTSMLSSRSFFQQEYEPNSVGLF